MTKLSIITVTYNNAGGLIETIQSVKSQTYKAFEFIIIDGGSVDNTQTIIDANLEIISKFVSEKDNGIFDAMNKGLAFANGEYCLFLNAGDRFYSETVVNEFVSGNFSDDIVYGDILKVKSHYRRKITYPDKLTLYDFYKEVAAIHHQASFIKRDLFEKYGLYREDLRINGDWEFFFRVIIKNRVSTRHLNNIIAVFDGNGISEKLDKRNVLNIKAKEFKSAELKSFVPDYILDDYKKMEAILTKKSIWRRIINKLTYFSLSK